MRSSRRSRQAYIDWLRGIAVLIMIWAHAFDAWTRLADRQAFFFRWALVVGGFAAPLFLFLAGLGVVLSASSKLQRSGSTRAAVEATVARGLEIFVLAYLFRLQAFIVTPGSSPLLLFRVDILNVMGPSMVLAGLLWGGVRGTRSRTAAFATLAAGIALATPVFRRLPIIDQLPTFVQWYLRPAGEFSTFAFFPWVGFAMAGAAVGVLVAAACTRDQEFRLHVVLSLVGVLLVGVGFYAAAQPTVYQQSFFWTTSPAFFAIRTGVMMLALSACYWTAYATGVIGSTDPLAILGRGSLFVYWIHVELVYGYATWPLRRHLSPGGVVGAYLLFSALMYLALLVKNRACDRWRSRGSCSASAAPTLPRM